MPATTGSCSFKMSQKYDPVLNAVLSVGAHNCKFYGVNLIVYFLTENLENKLEREFEVIDNDSGAVIMTNERKMCK